VTAELSPAKSSSAPVAVSTGKFAFWALALVAAGVVGIAILAHNLALAGVLFVGNVILLLGLSWMAATPRPLRPDEARPPLPSATALRSWALLVVLAGVAVACCALTASLSGSLFPLIR
jgi:hypothetical protein